MHFSMSLNSTMGTCLLIDRDGRHHWNEEWVEDSLTIETDRKFWTGYKQWMLSTGEFYALFSKCPKLHG